MQCTIRQQIPRQLNFSILRFHGYRLSPQSDNYSSIVALCRCHSIQAISSYYLVVSTAHSNRLYRHNGLALLLRSIIATFPLVCRWKLSPCSVGIARPLLVPSSGRAIPTIDVRGCFRRAKTKGMRTSETVDDDTL